MRSRLPNNFKIKLLSILIAFGMWIYVMEEIDPIMIRTIENVPIETIANISEVTEKGLTLSYNQDMKVGIDLRGKRSYLLAYMNSDIKPRAYIENPKAGENILTLSLPDVNGIEFSFNPAIFFVNLEESVIVEKTLDISYKGTPKESYSVGQINLNKQTVYVEGPKNQIEKVAKITGSVSIDNASRDFSQRVQLTPIDKDGQKVDGISISGSFVVAEVKMEKSKQVPIKLRLVNSGGELTQTSYLKQSSDTATITGTPDMIDKINEISTQVIFISDFNETPDKKYDFDLPGEIRIDPAKISLEIVADNEKEYILQIPKDKVQLLGNFAKEEIIEKLPPIFTVRFKSGKEYESGINDNTLKLYIDNTVQSGSYGMKFIAEYPVNNMVVDPSIINLD